MKLIARQLQLADSLSKQSGTKTIAEYATMLSVSKRTLSKDLNLVEQYLYQQGYHLIR